MATLSETRQGVDILIQRGEIVALLRDDGEVGYWPTKFVLPEQRQNQLSVREVRNLRRTQIRVNDPQ